MGCVLKNVEKKLGAFWGVENGKSFRKNFQQGKVLKNQGKTEFSTKKCTTTTATKK